MEKNAFSGIPLLVEWLLSIKIHCWDSMLAPGGEGGRVGVKSPALGVGELLPVRGFGWAPESQARKQGRNNMSVEHLRQIFSANFYRRERICHSCDPVEWVLLSLGSSQDHRLPPGHGKPNCMSINQWRGWFARDGNWEWCNDGDFPNAFQDVFSGCLQSVIEILTWHRSVWRAWPQNALCSAHIPWSFPGFEWKMRPRNIIRTSLTKSCSLSVLHLPHKAPGLDLRTFECQ